MRRRARARSRRGGSARGGAISRCVRPRISGGSISCAAVSWTAGWASSRRRWARSAASSSTRFSGSRSDGLGTVVTSLLLAFNFPPHEGGIARMMGEMARRYPPYSLLVSTGTYAGSAESDTNYLQGIDRVPVRAKRLRTVNGLLRWTIRTDALARRHRPRFTWCAELKPAAYPARWLRARYGIPYGVFTHGAELLLLDHKLRRSRFKHWTGRQLLDGASVFVANSQWTADYTRRILSDLGLDHQGDRVRTVPLGTDAEQFQAGLST